MNTPQDPRRHPLQDDEIDLARVLRALPAGEPSSKLDAAILGAAADAVAAAPATSPRRRVKAERWLPTWAIGTAAAAVLAVGVGTQLLPPLAPSADRSSPAGAPASPRTESSDRLDVDLIERKREYPPTYPPPPAAKATVRPQAAAPLPPPPPPAPSSPAPQAAPVGAEPFPRSPPLEDAGAFAPPPETDAASVERRGEQAERLRQSPAELNRAAAERRAQARQLEQLRAAREEAARSGASALQAPAPTLGNSGVVGGEAASMADAAPEMAESSEGRDYAEDRDGERAAADVYAPARQASAPGQALPPVSADTMLAPADWIARIRERWRAGDRDGALESLRKLRERHPGVAIPADLQALR